MALTSTGGHRGWHRLSKGSTTAGKPSPSRMRTNTTAVSMHGTAKDPQVSAMRQSMLQLALERRGKLLVVGNAAPANTRSINAPELHWKRLRAMAAGSVLATCRSPPELTSQWLRLMLAVLVRRPTAAFQALSLAWSPRGVHATRRLVTGVHRRRGRSCLPAVGLLRLRHAARRSGFVPGRRLMPARRKGLRCGRLSSPGTISRRWRAET